MFQHLTFLENAAYPLYVRKMHKEVDTLAKEILRQLAHKNNHCVIIVTHNPAVAEAADVVLKMKNGKLEIN